MGIIKGNRVIPYKELENIVEEASRAELYAMGLKVIREYFVPLSPADTETYVRGHRLRFTGRGFNVQMFFVNETPQAPYVEGGRLPGKRPPLHDILGWVRRHAIGEVYGISSRKLVKGRSRKTGKFVSGKDFLEELQVRAAKKIAAKIARFGQPGHFLYRDVEKYNAQIISATKARIQERVMALLQ